MSFNNNNNNSNSSRRGSGRRRRGSSRRNNRYNNLTGSPYSSSSSSGSSQEEDDNNNRYQSLIQEEDEILGFLEQGFRRELTSTPIVSSSEGGEGIINSIVREREEGRNRSYNGNNNNNNEKGIEFEFDYQREMRERRERDPYRTRTWSDENSDRVINNNNNSGFSIIPRGVRSVIHDPSWELALQTLEQSVEGYPHNGNPSSPETMRIIDDVLNGTIPANYGYTHLLPTSNSASEPQLELFENLATMADEEFFKRLEEEDTSINNIIYQRLTRKELSAQDMIDAMTYFETPFRQEGEEGEMADNIEYIDDGIFDYDQEQALLQQEGIGTQAAQQLFYTNPQGYRDKFGASRIRRAQKMLLENRPLPANPATRAGVFRLFTDPLTGNGLCEKDSSVKIPRALMTQVAFLVSSQVDDIKHPYYLVHLFNDIFGQCTCMDYRYRAIETTKITNCKHMLAARMCLTALERGILYANRVESGQIYNPESLTLPLETMTFQGLEGIQTPVIEQQGKHMPKGDFVATTINVKNFIAKRNGDNILGFRQLALKEGNEWWNLQFMMAVEEDGLKNDGVFREDYYYIRELSRLLTPEEKVLRRVALLLVPPEYRLPSQFRHKAMAPVFFMMKLIFHIGITQVYNMNERELRDMVIGFEYYQRLRVARYQQLYINGNVMSESYKELLTRIMSERGWGLRGGRQYQTEELLAEIIQVHLALQRDENGVEEERIERVVEKMKEPLEFRVSKNPAHPLDVNNQNWLSLSPEELITLENTNNLHGVIVRSKDNQDSPGSEDALVRTLSPNELESRWYPSKNASNNQFESQIMDEIAIDSLREEADDPFWLETPSVSESSRDRIINNNSNSGERSREDEESIREIEEERRRTSKEYDVIPWKAIRSAKQKEMERWRSDWKEALGKKKKSARFVMKTPKLTGVIGNTPSLSLSGKKRLERDEQDILQVKRQLLDMQLDTSHGSSAWIQRRNFFSSSAEEADRILSQGIVNISQLPSYKNPFVEAEKRLLLLSTKVSILLDAFKAPLPFSENQFERSTQIAGIERSLREVLGRINKAVTEIKKYINKWKEGKKNVIRILTDLTKDIDEELNYTKIIIEYLEENYPEVIREITRITGKRIKDFFKEIRRILRSTYFIHRQYEAMSQ